MPIGLGDAIGNIRLNTTGVVQAEKQVATSASAISQHFTNLTATINSTQGAIKGSMDSVAKALNTTNSILSNIFINTNKLYDDLQKKSSETANKIEADNKKTAQSYTTLGGTINSIATAMAGIGGLFAGKQIIDTASKTVVALNDVERRFTVITGSQEKARALMEQIRKEAERFGQSGITAQKSLIALVPNLKGGTEELQKMTGLALRLASTNQEQGLGGAVRAINEALSSGELTSLVDRFNLSRAAIRQALKETGGDFSEALDLVLSKMGATEEAALAAGQQFDASGRLLQESFNRAIAEGLKPFLDMFGQVLRGLAKFIDEIREVNPGLITTISGLAALSTVGGGLILTLNQISKALTMIKDEAPGVAKAMTAALAVTAGIEAGTAFVRLAANMGNTDLAHFKGKSQQEAKDMLGDTFKQLVVLITNAAIEIISGFKAVAIVLQNAFELLANILNVGANIIKAGIGGIIEALASIIDRIGAQIGGGIGADLQSKAVDLARPGVVMQDEAKKSIDQSNAEIFKLLQTGLMPTKEQFEQIEKDNQKMKQDILVPLIESFFPKKEDLPETTGTGGAQPASEFTQEQVDAWLDYRDKVEQINLEADRDLLREEQDFQRERLQKEAEFNNKLQREYDDEMLRRQRAEEKLNNQIAEVGIKAAQREYDLKVESETKITELTEKANTDETKRVQDHFDALAKIEKESREDIRDAARNLDAEGVRQAIRNREDAIDEENKKFEDGSKEQQQTLQQRITEEKRHYERRLEEGRLSDQREIERLKRHFLEDEAIRIADFNTKRQRAIDDFAAARNQEQIEHNIKMGDIREKAQRERNVALDHYIKELDGLTQHNARKLRYTDEYYKQEEQNMRIHYNNLRSIMNLPTLTAPNAASNGGSTYSNYYSGVGGYNTYAPTAPTTVSRPTTYNPSLGGSTYANMYGGGRYAAGGRLTRDGYVYGEKDETILNSTSSDIIQKMLGQEITGAALINALNRGNGGASSLNITNFNPQLSFEDIGSYSREEIVDIVGDALIEKLEEAVAHIGGMNG